MTANEHVSETSRSDVAGQALRNRYISHKKTSTGEGLGRESKEAKSMLNNTQQDARVKLTCLALLVAQNASVVLLMRSLRVNQRPEDGAITSAIVATTEIVKMAASLLMCMIVERKGATKVLRDMSPWPLTEVFALSVPSALYLFQNHLIYYSLQFMEPAVFQVVYNLKVIFSALLAYVVLQQELSKSKWGAIVMLFMGIALVASSSPPKRVSEIADGASAPTSASEVLLNAPVTYSGMSTTIFAAFLSAFSGTFTEILMKKGVSNNPSSMKASIWHKSLIMAVFSSMFGFLACYVRDRDEIVQRGFFAGFSPLVWTIVGLHAFGGLLIGAVLRYADNIAKSFATAISMIFSSLASVHYFGFEPSLIFVVGSSVVFMSIMVYARPEPELEVRKHV